MKYAKITGTGSYLPEKVLTNYDFEKIVDTSHEWIVARTGIEERHIAEKGETPVSMGAIAARRAVEAAGMHIEDIDLIVVTTVTPPYFFPSTACLLQKELGAKKCMAFDVQAACSGFVYALDVVKQYIQAGTVQNALLVSSEMLSRIADWRDRATCVLFGDGAGAVVVSASDAPGIIDSRLYADGYRDILYMHSGLYDGYEGERPYLKMQGRELFKLAVEGMRNSIKALTAENGLSIDEVDWIIPHQANARILDTVARLLKFPRERMYVTIDKHANTSSASIPLALDEGVRGGKIKRGQTVILEAFGSGLTWGGTLLKY